MSSTPPLSSSPRSPEAKPGSPRLRGSPRGSRQEMETEIEAPGIRIGVRYAETGDSQVLYFSENSTVEELKRQVMEYAEHGVSCKMNSMILLQEEGSSLVKTSVLLSSLLSRTVFMFSRETLLKSYVPTVALEDFRELDMVTQPNVDEEYEAFRRELCERCLSRCRVQIASGTVALRNLFEHSKSVMNTFSRFKSGSYHPYLEHAEVLSTLESDLEELGRVPLARLSPSSTSTTTATTSSTSSLMSSSSSSLAGKKTMLEALPREKILRWAEEATKQHALIEDKYQELQQLFKNIEDGCEQTKAEWASLAPELSTKADDIEGEMASSSLDVIVMELKALKQQTTRALFPTLLRSISVLQSKIQDLSNKSAALKEALTVQDQKISQVAMIRQLPDAYKAALKEAERRRQFALQFSTKVQQLTDYIAKERNKELDKREQFHKRFGKVLPPELVPGLTPWVFPVCEVTQRPIDPVLFANILELPDASLSTSTEAADGEESRMGENAEAQQQAQGELLFEAQELSAEHDLTAMEVLELQAENEFLRGQAKDDVGGKAFARLKQAHQEEIELLKNRVAELEGYMAERALERPQQQLQQQPTASGDHQQQQGKQDEPSDAATADDLVVSSPDNEDEGSVNVSTSPATSNSNSEPSPPLARSANLGTSSVTPGVDDEDEQHPNESELEPKIEDVVPNERLEHSTTMAADNIDGKDQPSLAEDVE